MTLSNSILSTAMALGLALPAGVIAASSPAAVPQTSAEAANIETARNLYAAIFAARDSALAARYLGPEYIQHAQDVADGKEGLARAIADIAAQTPQISYEIKHIIAEDNLVTLMSHVRPTPDSRGQMLFNIFRFDDGKIVEHWETVQDIPRPAPTATACSRYLQARTRSGFRRHGSAMENPAPRGCRCVGPRRWPPVAARHRRARQIPAWRVPGQRHPASL